MHPAKGQPTVPTSTVQHGITGVVAVFHRQTAGSVQPTLSQEPGPGIPRPRDTEAQLHRVSPEAVPQREEASFTVINKRDVDSAWVEQGVLAAVQRAG